MDGSHTITDQARYWLALNRITGLGADTVARLRRYAGSAAAIFELSPADLAQAGIVERQARQILNPDWHGVDRDSAWLQRPGNSLLTHTDDHYPALLREIPDPPLLLFVSGDPGVLVRPQLSVVGSRNPTPAGRECAAGFAGRLSRLDCVITSGLAIGIDAAAHEGALDADGLTVAVLGCGPDRIYPRRHKGLADRIRERGAIVTEFPPGIPPLATHFPRRNRIISGLSLGVLVVEAALRSGSLITARCAVEQGREVFAIPGSIRNPLARGCHALIRQGAKLVETVEDIIEECGPLLMAANPGARPANEANEPPRAGLEPDPEYVALLDVMGDAPVSVDLLVERSGLTADAVSSMLLSLELCGLVSAQPGGMYTRLR